jgi:hypothetical protein
MLMRVRHAAHPLDPQTGPIAARPVAEHNGAGPVGERPPQELGIGGGPPGGREPPLGKNPADQLGPDNGRGPMLPERNGRGGGLERGEPVLK